MLCSELVFGSSALRQIEFKGGYILKKLAETLFENYQRKKPQPLISNEVHRIVCATTGLNDRLRLICDHLSGMTDAYALRSYKRLFDPDYGSISELI
jgi:dGTPase